MLDKCKYLLDIRKHDLGNDGYGMKWIVEHLIENRSLLCWLSPIGEAQKSDLRFQELQQYCKTQSENEMHVFMVEIKKRNGKE